MADDQRNVTFNIGEQTGVNTNVAGDMTVYGGQQYVTGSPEEARADLAALREVVAGLGLQPEVQQEATDLIDEADRELAQPKPRPEKVGGPLTRLTNLLADVGAVASAGASVVVPLQRIGSWLGVAGKAILAVLV